MRNVMAAAVFSLLCAAPVDALTDEERGVAVSIYRLVANPEPYHEKIVFLTGFVTVELENMAVCPSRQSLSSKDCLWLDIDDGPFESEADLDRFEAKWCEWKKFNRQVVSLRATFDKDSTGHFGGWSGGLKKVTDVIGRKKYFSAIGAVSERCKKKRPVRKH